MSDYVSREDHEDRVAQINAHRMDLQDRIEAQAAEIARLREALETIANADLNGADDEVIAIITGVFQLQARAALEAKP